MTYSNVDSAMWDDEDFISLDDAARNVWQLLLTGPQKTALPGLQRAGMGTLAETLRRPVDDVTDAFNEIVNRNMAAFDPVHRIIWVPKAPKYNPATSPNQIRAWWNRWREVPDCELKHKHIDRLKEYAHLERPAHAKMWAETFGNPLRTLSEPSPNPLRGIAKPSERSPRARATETETDTDSETEAAPVSTPDTPEQARAAITEATDNPVGPESAFDLFCRVYDPLYAAKYGHGFAWALNRKEDERARTIAESAIKRGRDDAEQRLRHWCKLYLADDGERGFDIAAESHPIRMMAAKLPKYSKEPPKPRPSAPPKPPEPSEPHMSDEEHLAHLEALRSAAFGKPKVSA